MAEYDNTNKMAGWLTEKDGKKYISPYFTAKYWNYF